MQFSTHTNTQKTHTIKGYGGAVVRVCLLCLVPLEVFVIAALIDPSLMGPIQVAQSIWDYKAGLRGHIQLYTYAHVHTERRGALFGGNP